MEKLVAIKEQLPLQTRQYQDKNGENQVFKSVGFVMSDGVDTFYGEVVGNRAESCPQYDKAVTHAVQGRFRCRDYQDKNGNKRYENVFEITALV